MSGEKLREFRSLVRRDFANYLEKLKATDVVDDDAFREVLKTALNMCGLTHQEIAKEIGYTTPAISRWIHDGSLPRSQHRAVIIEGILRLVRNASYGA